MAIEKHFAAIAAATVLATFPWGATHAESSSRSARIVDLTHVISPGIPDFHGDSHAFESKQLFTVKKDGYANRSFSMPEHLGTHVDAPSHFVDGGKSIDQISVERLVLPCVVIDVRDEVAKNADYQLTRQKIAEFEKHGEIPEGSAVLLLTGWDSRWAQPDSYRNADEKGTLHYPAFSKESAEYLIEKRHASVLGLDTISLDNNASSGYPVHHIALGKGLILIENLTNLDKLPPRGSQVFFGALPMEGGTGSPARVIGIINQEHK